MYEQLRDEQYLRQCELRQFVNTLFLPTDLVELRLLETWREADRHQSRLIERRWLSAESVLAQWPDLSRLNNQGTNVFFGVNPRRAAGSTKLDIALCRVLWADLDDARPSDSSRWNRLPAPTVIVDSGHGVHLYWRLCQAVSLDSPAIRDQVEGILRAMYRRLAADAVQDVSRLLRLPGFSNVKNFRSGAPPTACRLAEIYPERSYPLDEFASLLAPRDSAESPLVQTAIAMSGEAFRVPRDVQRVRGLVRLLDKSSPDRSRRDFYVVCKLLEIGCTPQEVSSLVAGHSKFADNDEYLRRTLENAAAATKPSPEQPTHLLDSDLF